MPVPFVVFICVPKSAQLARQRQTKTKHKTAKDSLDLYIRAVFSAFNIGFCSDYAEQASPFPTGIGGSFGRAQAAASCLILMRIARHGEWPSLFPTSNNVAAVAAIYKHLIRRLSPTPFFQRRCRITPIQLLRCPDRQLHNKP